MYAQWNCSVRVSCCDCTDKSRSERERERLIGSCSFTGQKREIFIDAHCLCTCEALRFHWLWLLYGNGILEKRTESKRTTFSSSSRRRRLLLPLSRFFLFYFSYCLEKLEKIDGMRETWRSVLAHACYAPLSIFCFQVLFDRHHRRTLLSTST